MGRKTEQMTAMDKLIGANVAAKRIELGLSRYQLAQMVEVTHQQIQKYEKGANRLAASRLLDFAEALNMSIDDFFKGEQIPAPAKKRRALIEINRHLFTFSDDYIELVLSFVTLLSKGLNFNGGRNE